MAFQQPKKAPQFSDLVSVLAQSRGIDDALYQTVQEIINRLDQFASSIVGGTEGSRGATGPPGPIQPLDETFITSNTEPTLVNHRKLVAGTNITLDTAIANQIKVHASSGGSPGPHAPTHQPGGADPMQVDAPAATGSLRTLGTGPNQAVSGTDPRLSDPRNPLPHAITHSQGNLDPVDVKNLAGYPGGTTTFLRADHTFATPPTGGGGTGGGMQYLGDFVSGPTYNDGDVVVAADGIAYVCTVDGTTTPPEPWPGVGIAINPAVDATYWTVTNHPQLVSERALNTLANGYVQSVFGEPRTVQVIPITDGGTSAANAADARLNLGIGTVGPINLNGDARYVLNGAGTWSLFEPIPQNLVAIFFQNCPPGWGRVTTWDGYFLRGAATYSGVAVAANQHWHNPGVLAVVSHTHDQGTLTAGSHVHAGGTMTMPTHGHGNTVSISGTTGDAGDHEHSFSAGFGVESSVNTAGEMNVDAGSSGNMARGPHTHNVNGSVSGTTSNQGRHNHSFSGTGSIPNDGGQAISGSTAAATAGVTGSTGATAPGMTGNTDFASNTSHPAYYDVVYCYKL